MATQNVNKGTAYKLNFAAVFDGLCATFGEPTDPKTEVTGSSSYLAGRIESIVDGNAHLPSRCVQAVAGAVDAHEKWCDELRAAHAADPMHA